MAASPLPPPKAATAMPLYHEKQSLALCAVHAVNNLLQRNECSKSDFDAVCLGLSDSTWLNPHRSMLRIGDYDVNVVGIVLERHGLHVTWWDKRQELQADDLAGCVGVLWNVPSSSLLGRILRGRHWIALRQTGEEGSAVMWTNLDSMLAKPAEIGTHEQCVRLLKSLQNDCHILLVNMPTTDSG